jgi:hypothetical protein
LLNTMFRFCLVSSLLNSSYLTLATGGGSFIAVLDSLRLTTGGGLKAGVSTSNGI